MQDLTPSFVLLQNIVLHFDLDIYFGSRHDCGHEDTFSTASLGVMNTDTPALNESEEVARQNLVALCRAMLAGELSFFEGAIQVCSLRSSIRVSENDPDIMAFVVIESETDHLPPLKTQPLWSTNALQRLKPEFEKTETWAKSFASESCKNLIERFAKQ